MLVLTRKYMESLYIGDAIRVTVVRLDGGAVRLGIDAPKEVPVLRGELALRDRLEAAEEEPPAGPPLRRERRLRARGSDSRPRGPSQ